MKRQLTLLSALALLLSSCIWEDEALYRTSVTIHAGLTKSAGPVADGNYGSLQAIAFRPAGVMDGQVSYSYKATSITVPCTTGEREFQVYANFGNTQFPITRDALLSTPIRLEDETPTGLKMSQKSVFTVQRSNSPVAMRLVRYASKAQVNRITYSMAGNSLAGEPFTLNRLVLTNIRSGITLAGDVQDRWLNPIIAGEQGSGLYLESVGESLVPGDVLSTPYHLYMYPNPTVDDSYDKDVWSPRHTRLVFEATCGETDYYYPITLPAGTRNTAYVLENAIIARAGSLHPEDPLSYVSLEFSGELKDFDEVNGGVLEMGTEKASVAFVSDGVDPFEVFERELGMSQGMPVISFSDGSVSPFGLADLAAVLQMQQGLIIFSDGTVVAFQTVPENLDLSTVKSIILFGNGVTLESFLSSQLGIDLKTNKGVIIFSDGTVLPFDGWPENLDLETIRNVLLFEADSALESFLSGSLGLDVSVTKGLVFFSDGTMIPFEHWNEDMSLETVSSIITASIGSLQSFLSESVGLTLSMAKAVINCTPGSLAAFSTTIQNLTLNRQDVVFLVGSADLKTFESILEDVVATTPLPPVITYRTDSPLEFGTEYLEAEFKTPGREA